MLMVSSIIIQQAKTYKQERVNQAEGDAGRFIKMANEYKLKGKITSNRLYLETMEHVMERINKIFVQDGKEYKPLDLNIIDLEGKE